MLVATSLRPFAALHSYHGIAKSNVRGPTLETVKDTVLRVPLASVQVPKLGGETDSQLRASVTGFSWNA